MVEVEAPKVKVGGIKGGGGGVCSVVHDHLQIKIGVDHKSCI